MTKIYKGTEIIDNWGQLKDELVFFTHTNDNPISSIEPLIEHCQKISNVMKNLQIKCHKRIVIVETDSMCILLNEIDSPDRGKIYSFFEEMNFPIWNKNKLKEFGLGKNKKLLKNIGLEVIDKGIGEYIVPLDFDSFEQHKKHLSQIGRCWNKNIDLEVVYGNTLQSINIPKQDLTNMCFDNNMYFFKKMSKKPIDVGNFDLASLNTTNQILLSNFPSNDMVSIKLSLDGKCVGIALFSWISPTEIYWINSLICREEEYKKRSLGNYILLSMLKILYNMPNPNHLSLNLGIDVFTYKKAWKPKHKYSQGLGGLIQF